MTLNDSRLEAVWSQIIHNPTTASFEWHSLICICSSCLDADAAAYAVGTPNHRIDMQAIQQ